MTSSHGLLWNVHNPLLLIPLQDFVRISFMIIPNVPSVFFFLCVFHILLTPSVVGLYLLNSHMGLILPYQHFVVDSQQCKGLHHVQSDGSGNLHSDLFLSSTPQCCSMWFCVWVECFNLIIVPSFWGSAVKKREVNYSKIKILLSIRKRRSNTSISSYFLHLIPGMRHTIHKDSEQ